MRANPKAGAQMRMKAKRGALKAMSAVASALATKAGEAPKVDYRELANNVMASPCRCALPPRHPVPLTRCCVPGARASGPNPQNIVYNLKVYIGPALAFVQAHVKALRAGKPLRAKKEAAVASGEWRALRACVRACVRPPARPPARRSVFLLCEVGWRVCFFGQSP